MPSHTYIEAMRTYEFDFSAEFKAHDGKVARRSALARHGTRSVLVAPAAGLQKKPLPSAMAATRRASVLPQSASQPVLAASRRRSCRMGLGEATTPPSSPPLQPPRLSLPWSSQPALTRGPQRLEARPASATLGRPASAATLREARPSSAALRTQDCTQLEVPLPAGVPHTAPRRPVSAARVLDARGRPTPTPPREGWWSLDASVWAPRKRERERSGETEAADDGYYETEGALRRLLASDWSAARRSGPLAA